MKDPKSPYAECNGKFYVLSNLSGIPPFCMLVDGTAQVFFGEERSSYILLDEAIAWHEKERSTGMKRKIAETLIRARDRFLASPGEGVRP